MVDRWTVERAVRHRACTLDPPGRQIVLTLLTWTDHDTAMIPERYTPSLTDLVHATGLARSTVAAWLNKLEQEGWVVRIRPTVADARKKKARTVYALKVPAGPLSGLTGAEASPAGGPTESDSPRSAGPGRGPAKSGTGSGRGLALVRQADRVGPPDGLNPYREQDQPVGGGSDHRYVEGANGYCAHPGCGRSVVLHGRPQLTVVKQRERRVIGK